MSESKQQGHQVILSFLLTKEDYSNGKIAASRAAYRHGEIDFLRWSGFFLVLSGLVLRVFFAPNAYSKTVYMLMVLLGTLIGFYIDNWQPLLVRWQAQRFYDSRGERILAQTIQFYNEKISITTDRYHAEIPLEFLHRVYEDGKVFLLYTGRDEVWVIPKRALPPWDLMKVRELLKRNENYKREGVR